MGIEGEDIADFLYADFLEYGIEDRFIYEDICEQFAYLKNDHKTLKKLRKLSSLHRFTIVKKTLDGWNSEAMQEYLDAIEVANYPRPVFFHSHGLEELQKTLVQASYENMYYEEVGDDFTDALYELFAAAVNSKVNNKEKKDWMWNDFYHTSLFILRSVYGESSLTELLRHISKAELTHIMTVSSLIKILKDWENMKSYPVQWMLELSNTE